jgi:hypothetical protein
MKGPSAIVLLIVIVLLLALGLSRSGGGLLDRCLNLDGRWGDQVAACGAQMWPDDRSRERE